MMYLEVDGERQAELVLDQAGLASLLTQLEFLKSQNSFDHVHFVSDEWGGTGELEGNAPASTQNRIEHLKIVFLP